MRKGRLSALVLLLALGGCVREQVSPPVDTQAAPLPSAPPEASEALKQPPTVALPELAGAPEPGTGKGARDFVTAFMQSRMARDERLARSFLSPTARDQFDKREGGLTLTAAYAGAGWDFVSVNAADASSFEVKVRVREKEADGETTHTETLFVGPGPDLQGTQRPWVVRGVRREG